jgi:segregation and condensation protein A
MTLQEDYRVTLDTFEGPLDLLLHLIRRAEVDIHDISVALITDQYLGFLRDVETVDVEIAGDFLVMAATLIELKSRTLMPPEEGEEAVDGSKKDEGPEDPRDELIRVLLMYQRFRDAAERLEQSRLDAAASRPRAVGRAVRQAMRQDRTDPERTIELEDVHPMDLAEAYEAVMSSVDLSRLGDHVVEVDDTPLELHRADLVDRLERAEDHRLTLQQVFQGARPLQRIGMFLATLELTRQRRIDVQQDDVDDPIQLVLRDPEEDATGEAVPAGVGAGVDGPSEAEFTDADADVAVAVAADRDAGAGAETP